MAASGRQCWSKDPVNDAIATATYLGKVASAGMQIVADSITGTTIAVSKTAVPTAQRFVEEGTETVGKIVTPIAEHPLTKYATKVPGINLLATALGQVDIEKAQNDLDKLRQDYPQETPEQLAQRVIVDTALKAGGIGVITNFVPPLALALFGVELAALTALQAEMVYRIAGVYGFPLKDPTRRGEVLAIFGLSVGGSGTLKLGLGFVEVLPVIGTFVGASTNTALIYSLGQVAKQFYEAKRNSSNPDSEQ